MIRKLIPFAAAGVMLLVFLGPARSLLPGQLRTSGSLVANDQPAGHEHDTTTTSSVGLAPAPVVNPPATAARVAIQTQPAEKSERGYVLEATVRAPSGDALADAPVKFYELVDLFGTREMYIGSSVTDGRGAASITYLPAQSGTHRFVVRTSPVGKVSAGEARVSFEASAAAQPAQAPRSPLAIFSDKVPYAVGLLVLAVWGLIAFALVATARGVIGGARQTSRKGEPA